MKIYAQGYWGSVQAPMARALDLRGFKRAPVARSYSRIACCIVLKPPGFVTSHRRHKQ